MHDGVDTLTELKAEMKAWRAQRKGRGSRGQAIYDLNKWLGEERQKLQDEYQRRRSEIEAMPEEKTLDSVSPHALDLVYRALQRGASRTAIRIALGKATLIEADEVIEAAREQFLGKVEAGEESALTLTDTGEVHARGWRIYDVTLQETGETYPGVHLVTPQGATPKRAHLRITPAPPGSVAILDHLWDAGVSNEMERGA